MTGKSIAVGMFGLVAAMTIGGTAEAKQWRVAMVNAGPEGAMSFSPAFVKVAPGDEVVFVAQDKAHNAQSIPGLSPAGSAAFKGAMNQDVTVKFTTPGLYGYECLPHFSMGMVGMVQVGKPVNKAAVAAGTAKLPPLAKARMTKYLALAR